MNVCGSRGCGLPRGSGRALARALVLTAVVLTNGLGPRAHAQNAVFLGRVLDANTERPIAGAQIDLLPLKRSVRSDSGGKFQLRALPVGEYEIRVRVLGYDSLTATMRVGVRDSVDTDFLMSASVKRLGTVLVEASRPARYGWRLQDFDERRTLGLGKFLDWSFFEKFRDRALPGLLIAQVPGIRTRRVRGEEYLISSRYGRSCYPQVFVNGLRTEGFDLQSISAGDIIGFEYYTVASTPMRFRSTGTAEGGSQCGTALFWMK